MTATDLNVFLQQYPATNQIRLNPVDYGTLLSSFVTDGSEGAVFAGNLGSTLGISVPIEQDFNVPPGTIQGD